MNNIYIVTNTDTGLILAVFKSRACADEYAKIVASMGITSVVVTEVVTDL